MMGVHPLGWCETEQSVRGRKRETWLCELVEKEAPEVCELLAGLEKGLGGKLPDHLTRSVVSNLENEIPCLLAKGDVESNIPAGSDRSGLTQESVG